MPIAHQLHFSSPDFGDYATRFASHLRRNALPLAAVAAAAVALLMWTAVEWRQTTQTLARSAVEVPALTLSAGGLSPAALQLGDDPFYEQKKAAIADELPAQF